MRLPLLAAGALVLALAGCTPSSLAGVDQQSLEDEVARSIGDPSTCVLLADGQSGKIVWSSNLPSVCRRKIDLCTRPGKGAPKTAIKDVMRGARLAASCNSSFGPGRTVGWAGGRANGKLIYVAVMEGDRALPGSEIQSRVEEAFQRAGLTE